MSPMKTRNKKRINKKFNIPFFFILEKDGKEEEETKDHTP